MSNLPYLVHRGEPGQKPRVDFNSDLLARPEYTPQQEFISKEDLARAECLVNQEVWGEEDQVFVDTLLPKLQFWNDHVLEHFRYHLERQSVRAEDNISYLQKFQNEDWPTSKLTNKLAERSNAVRTVEVERIFIADLLKKVLDGMEIVAPEVAQTAKLKIMGDGEHFASLDFGEGLLNGRQIAIDFDPDTGSLQFGEKHKKTLTDIEVFLIASNADPASIRASISHQLTTLMTEVHVHALNEESWRTMHHTSAREHPFVKPLDLMRNPSYTKRLKESGARELTRARRSNVFLTMDDGDKKPIKLPHEDSWGVMPSQGLIFIQRHGFLYLQIQKQMEKILGDNTLLEQALLNPAMDPDELAARQELFAVVEAFVASTEAGVLLDFLEGVTIFLQRKIHFKNDMENPLDDFSKTPIRKMLDLDFSTALAPLLALKNPLFRTLAENLLKNSERLKAAWRKILEESETKPFGAIITDPNFSSVEAFYPIFELHPFRVLANELAAYKERLNLGGSFGNLEPADHISLQGVMPIIINPDTGIVPGERLVPLNLKIPKSSRIFILRGPNTGGKSTVLRSIDLTKQLGQAALPLPVNSPDAHIKMPISGCIDMTQRQEDKPGEDSTFQAQIKRLELLMASSPDVVTMDEYGLASTQGAQFILDEMVLELTKSGTFIIIAVQDKSDIERLEELFTDESPDGVALQHAHMTYEIQYDGEKVSITPKYTIADGKPADEIEEMPFLVAGKLMPGRESLIERARVRYQEH